LLDLKESIYPLGRIADHVFLERYMRTFFEHKAQHLKEVAESDAWRRYLV